MDYPDRHVVAYRDLSSSILILLNKYRRPIIRNGVKVSFLLQENAITSSNIPLLRILGCIAIGKRNLASLPDECVTNICKAIIYATIFKS